MGSPQIYGIKETRRLFHTEPDLPSKVIDRGSARAWQAGGSLDTFAWAKQRVNELLATYKRPAIATNVERELRSIVEREAKAAGMETLPGL